MQIKSIRQAKEILAELGGELEDVFEPLDPFGPRYCAYAPAGKQWEEQLHLYHFSDAKEVKKELPDLIRHMADCPDDCTCKE